MFASNRGKRVLRGGESAPTVIRVSVGGLRKNTHELNGARMSMLPRITVFRAFSEARLRCQPD